MNKIIECVPNFSEGRDLQKIDQIISPFRGKQGVKLLDYSNDEDHNRLVVTVVGEPEPLRDAVLEAIGIAVKLIDLNHHTGQHPRMGAVVERQSLMIDILLMIKGSENKNKKTSKKVWMLSEKVLIFASAFVKKAVRRRPH